MSRLFLIVYTVTKLCRIWIYELLSNFKSLGYTGFNLTNDNIGIMCFFVLLVLLFTLPKRQNLGNVCIIKIKCFPTH